MSEEIQIFSEGIRSRGVAAVGRPSAGTETGAPCERADVTDQRRQARLVTICHWRTSWCGWAADPFQVIDA